MSVQSDIYYVDHYFLFFFFNDTATTEIYTLSLHDALPISLLEQGDRIWVHDYHLMCLPGCLRHRGVRNPTGFYLHVPFPSPEAAAVAPGIRGLLGDVLNADMLGFQTASDRDNFAAAAANFGGAHRAGDETMHVDGREVRLGVFPAEISPREFAATAEIHARAEPSRLLAD